MATGPQKDALESEADILFFGGAAGGGKTDLLLGLALTRHKRSIIFRREFKQVTAIEDRAAEILGTRDGYNSQSKIWRLSDRQLEFGACQHLGDEQAYQGRPHDMKGFDELTHFTEHQFRFLCGWLRTTDPQQRCRIVGAGNPPTDSDGDWVIRFWSPWLDPNHPNPAAPGELRWFATLLDGEEVELETGEPFERDGELITPKSRTFIPSHVEDNPYLMASGYKATLQALPEPLRSQMLRGDFTAGRQDNPWQIIPSAWIEAAQERWKQRERPNQKMTAMGVDPSRGGADEFVLAPRWGEWFGELQCYPGEAAQDGPAGAALVVSQMRDGARISIDVIGIGSSVYDHLNGSGPRVLAMDAREKTDELDRNKVLGFANKRAEWWWRFREALDPTHDSQICLPPDSQLKADLCAPRWKHTARGVQVEMKEEIEKRIGRSTDRGDAVVMAHATPAYQALPDNWNKPLTVKRGTIA